MPEIRHLFRGFRANLWALIPIGVVLVARHGARGLRDGAVDGGELLEAHRGNGSPTRRSRARSVEAAMLFASVCAVPVAARRCGSRRHSSSSGLRRRRRRWRTSLRAALANWKPVAVYALLLFVFGAVVPAVAVELIALVLPPDRRAYRRRADGRSLRLPVHRRADDLGLRELPRHLPLDEGRRHRRSGRRTRPA